MWMKKKGDKEKEKGEPAARKVSNDAEDGDDLPGNSPGASRGRGPAKRRGSGDKDPVSPVSAASSAATPSRPRRMSFDAAANADMVKSALGDVNSIIMQAAQQQKDSAASAKANGRRGSFTAAQPLGVK